jgi:hypothetical protein
MLSAAMLAVIEKTLPAAFLREWNTGHLPAVSLSPSVSLLFIFTLRSNAPRSTTALLGTLT